LRAGPLEELGLRLALEQMARSTAERDGLKLEMHIPPNVDDLDPTVEQCVFRIAEEGLHNVSQHARATRFMLSLEKQPKKLNSCWSTMGRD
jgi:signal transduction histidine kinase